ncbi:MAG: hypothetical protein IKG58_01075 [Bacilli bacterium]|nr:hypothetical protein [Bacilli bacterium]MBR3049137.1 hypothetical protein [Bacilli bacterium]
MEFIKKNKFVCIAIAVFLVVILLLVQIKNTFFPNEEHAIYGNRLEGSDKVKISNSKKKTIESSITSDGIAKKATIRVSGRIIEVMITVEAETSVDVAKSLTDIITKRLTSEEKHFYDIQVFIIKEEKSSNFPIIGYKHHKKKNFSWTKNR